MDCSLPGSSVHGISQARILGWVAISSSMEYFWPRDQTHISCIDRWILYHWATREASSNLNYLIFKNPLYIFVQFYGSILSKLYIPPQVNLISHQNDLSLLPICCLIYFLNPVRLCNTTIRNDFNTIINEWGKCLDIILSEKVAPKTEICVCIYIYILILIMQYL